MLSYCNLSNVKELSSDLLDIKISQFNEAIQKELIDAIEHGIIVSNLTYLLAKNLGLSETDCYLLAWAGLVHDIGKLRISDYIYRQDKDILVVEEMKYIQMHPTFGRDILQQHGFHKKVVEAVYHHHENYDGSGYPQHLTEDSIPLGGRILRTCDVFVALITNRPYRKAYDFDQVITLMIEEVKNFDMKIFLTFLNVVHSEEFMKIKNNIDTYNKKNGGK